MNERGGSGGAAGAASGAAGTSGTSAGQGSGGATATTGGNGSAAGGGAGGSPPTLTGSGTISYERWSDVPGEAVSLLPVDEKPDATLELSLFQMPDDVGQDFAARIRGYLTAPVTGDYTFWISCDDNGELDLSTDELPANKRTIAHVTGSPAWTDYVEWSKFPTQKSQLIPLVAGRRYYVEASLKEDIAEDHLAVGWLKPGEVGSEPSEIIPGRQLTPFSP